MYLFLDVYFKTSNHESDLCDGNLQFVRMKHEFDGAAILQLETLGIIAKPNS